ncbi:MAG: 1-acyl-sn-glycerol-3-phosphate acyltransferase, partial [Clostridia bacterium]|nr:1-acyl-sn-glycerol-3-phosphate acyltransferase [Clostridia bacterium]
LGEEIKDGSIVLSNHVGKTAPLKLECYLKKPFRFWGAHEMNEGFKALYKYQSEVFYHQKQHWNLTKARIFCCVAAPLTYMFYSGLNLISTYKDVRFRKTIDESVETLEKNQTVIIFPEDSSEGYLDELKSFYSGFVVLANTCYKKGMDLPIYVMYYRKKEKTFVVDKPILYSELIKEGVDKDKIAEKLCNRANELKDIKINK